jgi:hypothetical protein
MDRNNKPRWFHQPQTVAWLVVTSSFVLFCVICAAGTAGAYWFLFESPANLTTHLTVSQGTVTILYPDGISDVISDPAANPKVLQIPNTIKITDNTSQAYITFEDNYSKQVIASVFLIGNGSFKLSEASRPRFEWSKRQYTILMTNSMGHFAVDIPSQVSRPLVLNLQSAAGAARFSERGSYSVDALEQSIKLYSQSGRGLLVTPSFEARQIEAGMDGTLSRDNADVLIQPYPFQNLIVEEIRRVDPSSAATDSFGDDDVAKNPRLPSPWACANSVAAVAQNEPEGTWQRTPIGNQVGLLMARGDKISRLAGHAETGCELWFEAPYGLNVANYNTLRVHLRMNIRYQDVRTCGIRGSECPVMLLVDYLPKDDPQGQVRVWRQGFYSERRPDDSDPQTCDTCIHVHEQINENTWYIYESSDLLKEFPEEQKPVSIVTIRVYSSGHQYDVSLAELALLGGR